MKSALIVGATGVVGRELVQQLCQHPDYDLVVAWVRRPFNFEHPKLQVEIIDFDQLGEMPLRAFEEIDGALGTTIKLAGSKDAFRKVDFVYPVQLAEWGKRAGTPTFVLVSAPGANPDSSFFYLKTKGETEEAVKACDYSRLFVCHPPIIEGNRPDRRLGEELSIRFFKCLPKRWVAKYYPMRGADIAAAILRKVATPSTGIHYFRPYEV